MSTLTIRKKSLKTWLHSDSVLGDFIISKFYFNADGVNFQIVEQGQSKRVIYDITDITLYDEVNGGVAETFATITELSLRLEALNYPAFFTDGTNPTIGFTDLTDTPNSYTGQANKIVKVKATEDGVEFVEATGVAVETVTGALVDNTDPLNPIVNVPSLAQVLSIRGREINVQTGASYNLELSNKYEYISYQAGATSAQIQLVDDIFAIGDEIIIYNKDTDFLEIASSISIPPSIYYNGTNYDTQNTIIIPMYAVARMVCVANNYFELTIQEVSNSTLQQVLDNNHDLVDGKNFQGTASGQFNTGVRINAFGTGASGFNSGNDVNAFGNNAGINNSGNNVNGLGRDALASNSAEQVNAFGEEAGSGNVYKNVNLFGFQATADADNQTVFSKWVSGITKYLGRLSFNNITADRKWELPDTSGTVALTSDIPSPITIDATPTDGSANAVSSNGVFDALALKVDKNDWVDYSATSTIVGWSSFDTKKLFIKIIDNTLFCIYNFYGTSNSNQISFTINQNSLIDIVHMNQYTVNGNVVQSIGHRIDITNGSNTIPVALGAFGSLTSWSASNKKGISGQFFIKL